MNANSPHDALSKDRSLEPARQSDEGQYLTTNQGVRINHTDDSLKAGERGPTLLEGFHFREKITHFDHERIPERAVHARGAAAHGFFQVYESLADLTCAAFLQDPAVTTPVFVRFSTVAGSRGSADTVRDVRGFATKFYTQEGVFDLVGNNIPIFFIQDAIKFPDLVHAVKPEPDNEIPQAATAHDTAWDFFSLLPEATHMVMWAMSDRAIPPLNRNPDNFFAETEQAAFHPGHVVPGIDFSNDPLLQGRLFSYLDTQINRFGSANFAEIPINRPIAAVHNNQRDGFMQQDINKGKASYYPNSLGGGCPMVAPESAGGYASYPARVEGRVTRDRSESFKDYFSQATLFWKSLSPAEQDHLVAGACFELGKVVSKAVRTRMLGLFAHVDPDLAQRISQGIGVAVPQDNPRPGVLPPTGRPTVEQSPALSMANTVKDTIKSRRVAVLAANGVDAAALQAVKTGLQRQGAHVEIVAPVLGTLAGADGSDIEADKGILTVASVMYDAVFVPCGQGSVQQLGQSGDALHFVAEAYKHAKPIGATGEGVELLRRAGLPDAVLSNPQADGETSDAQGVVTARDGTNAAAFVTPFAAAIAQRRHWLRPQQDQIPA